jgi:hypothetical protein
MDGVGLNLSYPAQLVGLLATFLGTGVGIVGVLVACVAARRAKGAREQAELAKRAAIRLGRIAQIGDLIDDMHELQTMVARSAFAAIADKADLLRGRIVRWKTQAYTELIEEEKESLDLARDQLQFIARVAASDSSGGKARVRRIRAGFGQANEALNTVAGRHAHLAEGE